MELKDIYKINKKSIKDAGPRYSSENNVKTDFRENYIAFLRVKEFKQRIEKSKRRIDVIFKNIIKYSSDNLKKIIKKNKYDENINFSLNIIFSNIKDINPFDKIETEPLKTELENIFEIIEKIKSDKIEKKQNNPIIRDFRIEITKLEKILELIDGGNKNIFLITGEAGIGKTHSLCDTTYELMKDKYPVLFITGDKLTEKAPILSQICSIFKITGSENSFLDFIEKLKDQRNQKVCLVIDAINEGKGYQDRKKELFNFLQFIKKQKNIRLIISCRSDYKDALGFKYFDPCFFEKQHKGFHFNLVEAVESFFNFYKIIYHNIPISDDFSKPLFLKIYCKTFSNKKIKRSKQGITALIEIFFKEAGKKLKKKYRDCNPDILWKFSKNFVAKYMVDNKIREIESSELMILEENFKKENSLKNSFLDFMLSEGLLIKSFSSENKEVLAFSYDKFTDHILCRHLLRPFHSQENNENFNINELKRNLKEDHSGFVFSLNKALSIEIPERTNGKWEFIELCEGEMLQKNINPLNKSFIESFAWRSETSVNIKKALKRINDISGKTESFKSANPIEIFLSVSTKTNNPLNANFLHNNCLKDKKMIDRDVFWTKYLNRSFEGGIAKTMIEMSFLNFKKLKIDKDSKKLLCIIYCWFFTSPHRALRDQSTKSLTRVLLTDSSIPLYLLENFKDVDDPYVAERLLTSIYGSISRSNSESLEKIAEKVINDYLKNKKYFLNIVIRYLGFKIIQNIKSRGIEVNFDFTDLSLKTDFPDKLPSMKQLRNKYDRFGRGSLLSVQCSLGLDFGEYTIGRGYLKWFDKSEKLNSWENKESKVLNEDQQIHQEVIKRYILNEILDLNYGKRFDFFEDRIIQTSSIGEKTSNKKERMGKKYQWIYYFEALGLLFDHFEFKDRYSGHNINIKDLNNLPNVFSNIIQIDPTVIVRNKKEIQKTDDKNNIEYNEKLFENYLDVSDYSKWYEDKSFFNKKNILKLVEYKKKWICMNLLHFLREDEENLHFKKDISIHGNAIVFPISDKKNIIKEFEGKDPSNNGFTDLRRIEIEDRKDYFYDYQNKKWEEWWSHNEYINNHNQFVFRYYPAVKNYSINISQYDYSTNETTDSLMMPSDIFSNIKYDLSKEGQFKDKKGNIIAVNSEEIESDHLFMSKEYLNNFLRKKEYGLAWFIEFYKTLKTDKEREELRASYILIFYNNKFELNTIKDPYEWTKS